MFKLMQQAVNSHESTQLQAASEGFATCFVQISFAILDQHLVDKLSTVKFEMNLPCASLALVVHAWEMSHTSGPHSAAHGKTLCLPPTQSHKPHVMV